MRNLFWKNKGNRIGGLRPIHRLLMVLLGVFITFTVIEITLRIGSIIVWNLNKQHMDIDKGAYNILCVGDSYTYGTGASTDENYPRHLQRMLNRKFGIGYIRVHNTGTPGHNSSQVRDKLLSQLKTTNAKILIILIGHNNYWNFNDLHLEGINPGLVMKIERLLGHLKVCRLLKILMTNLSEKVNHSKIVNDDILNRYFEFQESRQRMDKFQKEIKQYQQYLSGHPRDIYPYLKLATIYGDMGEKDRARQLIDRAYGIDPVGSEQLLKQQREIEEFHRGRDQRESFKRLFQTILRRTGIPRTRAAFKRYLDFQQEIVEEVLRQDIIWMVEIARRRGVKVIISSYPIKKKANRMLCEMNTRLGVPFVDQEAAFQALEGETSHSDYFTLDGHCTGVGYQKMAEEIAEALKDLV